MEPATMSAYDELIADQLRNLSSAIGKNNWIAEERKRDVASPETYLSFLKVSIFFRLAICLVGLFSNALCLRTFHRMGLEDSVTIVFFALAMADLCHVIVGLVYAIMSTLVIVQQELGVWLEFMPAVLTIFCVILIRMFCEANYLATTFLAIQRCLCVARPLHFKAVFTRCRTYLVIGFVWLLSLSLNLTFMLFHDVIKSTHPFTNKTMYMIVFKPGRETVANITYITFGIVLNVANQIIVLVCLFVMARALSKSADFRKKASASSAQNDTKQQNTLPVAHTTRDSKNSASVPTRSDAKEQQAIAQVALLSIIFLISNTPRLSIAIAAEIEPEFELTGQYHHIFSIFFVLMTTLEHLNSSANFFVYYKYNTKFRSLCFQRKLLPVKVK